MYDPHGPSLGDDVRSVANIVLPALVSIVLTAGVIATLTEPDPRRITIELSEPEPLPEEIDPAAGADRMYGRVLTADGSELEGYLRWNGREASWADVLQATRRDDNAFSGIRFGHVRRVERLDARSAAVTLKSGEAVHLTALMAEGRAMLSPLAVEAPGRPGGEVPWSEVEAVELLAEPVEHRPVAERLHGTLVTRSGLSFTGYLTWDGDKMYATDVLDGEPGTGEGAVAFADVASIQVAAAGEALVTLRAGGQGIVRGTDDVGASNRGIVVSDPALGVVEVPWTRLRELRFHAPETPATYETFDGGEALAGTVLTRAGEKLSGRIRWDRDEANTWDLLDGQLEGMRFRVELGQVARIQRFRFGAAVDLRDGRSFYLSASQDVNWTNRGIEVHTGGSVHVVPWDDFVELRLDPGS